MFLQSSTFRLSSTNSSSSTYLERKMNLLVKVILFLAPAVLSACDTIYPPYPKQQQQQQQVSNSGYGYYYGPKENIYKPEPQVYYPYGAAPPTAKPQQQQQIVQYQPLKQPQYGLPELEPQISFTYPPPTQKPTYPSTQPQNPQFPDNRFQKQQDFEVIEQQSGRPTVPQPQKLTEFQDVSKVFPSFTPQKPDVAPTKPLFTPEFQPKKPNDAKRLQGPPTFSLFTPVDSSDPFGRNDGAQKFFGF